jgi:hypothetical protein
MNSSTPFAILFLMLLLPSLNHAQDLSEDIPQGKFIYELYFAEWGGNFPNAECLVEIIGDSIVIRQTVNTGLTGPEIIISGILMKHKSGIWIIGDKASDRESDEIGGCTGGPVPIDFKKRIVEWC